MSPTLDPEKHLSELTLMYTNAGAKFSGPSNTALFMPVYTAETANLTIDPPAPATPAPGGHSKSVYEPLGSPSQWPDASPEPCSPASDDAATSAIYWYQHLPEAARDPEVAAVAAAIAACSASAAELSRAAAACTAAAAAISAAASGALAGNACAAAATAILAAGIPSANACSAAADACAAAADGWFAAGASGDAVLPSPEPSPFLSGGGGGGGQDAPRESVRSASSGRFVKAQAPYEQPGTRSLRSAVGTRSLRSANETHTPGSNGKDPNLAAGKGPQAAGVGYNLRSVKEAYNLRTAKKDGTPKALAGKRSTRSAVSKHGRKGSRKSV